MPRTQIAIATLLLVAACTADDAGTIEVALTGQAPSGTTYRLRHADLVIASPGVTRVLDTEDDPDRAAIHAELPPGAYTLGVSDGWYLERRAADGSHQRVTAVMTTPNPTSFVIQADTETRLTLRFLAGADDVALGNGDLAIDIGIDEVDAAVPDAGPGGLCAVAADCGAGLFCVDGVCCSSACAGGCEACDLPGAVGTCTAVAAGEDPDAECGAVSCAGHFAGFLGSLCFGRADVAADAAACDGAGACRSADEECALQTAPGPVVAACDADCQSPEPGTCLGTVPGRCANSAPGVQECGVGQCRRVEPRCVNGAPVACTPGAPVAEACNDLDDDCDGVTDDGAFSDGFEPNIACASATVLAAVGSEQTASYESMTIYGSGDEDYYAVTMNETDTSCGCAFPADIFDEDYFVTVELTVPPGGGSYEVCMRPGGSCAFESFECIEVAAGQSGRIERFFDGTCTPLSPVDAYDVRIRVRGDNAPAFECRPYTLRYTFDAGHCRT
jgi:hypothetical protein